MKIKFNFKTLRASLVFYQALLIVLILLIAGAFSYVYISNTFVKMILHEQNSLGTSLSVSMENELDQMNIVSMNISYSNLLKGMFKDYQETSYSAEVSSTRVKKYNDQSRLFDSILAIMGYFNEVSQVNLYTFDGFMVGSGLFNEETKVELIDIPEIQEAIKLNGYKYLPPPKKNEYLVRRNLHLKDHYFLSLLRVFKDQYHRNEGIVEVLQDCETLFSFIELQKKNKKNLRVYIFDDMGNFIYPYDDLIISHKFNLLKLIKSPHGNNSISTIDIDGDSQEEIFSTFKIEKYKMNLILIESKNEILKPLRRFQLIFFIFIFFITLYTIIVSYSVSSRVTRPLDRLIKYFSSLKLNNTSLELFENYKPSDKTFVEIDSLYTAFNLMSGKLKKSLNDLIRLKDQEALTRLLTLQSQMNPHFLYNNLANISVLAEENKNDKVVSMCKDISFMLRYSNVIETKGATIKAEIEYVKKYLTCMKLRYEDDLIFSIDYPKEMDDIRIPRIVIQPLVENSINHGFTTEPPWNIKIKGVLEDRQWTFKVTDNGKGFSADVLDHFDFILENNTIDNNLGLENTRQRLKLIYKEQALFKLSNTRDGGASVTIGGGLNYKEHKNEE